MTKLVKKETVVAKYLLLDLYNWRILDYVLYMERIV